MKMNRMHTRGVTIAQIPSENMFAGRPHADGITTTKIL
jgi:hypothetical protein